MVDLSTIFGDADKAAVVVGKIAAAGAPALALVRDLNDWSPVPIPFLNGIIDTLQAVQPTLASVAAAASIADKAIKAGEPVAEKIQREGFHLIPDLIAFAAAATGQDPSLVTPEAAIALVEHSVKSVAQKSYFTPQDPRFDRMSAADA